MENSNLNLLFLALFAMMALCAVIAYIVRSERKKENIGSVEKALLFETGPAVCQLMRYGAEVPANPHTGCAKISIDAGLTLLVAFEATEGQPKFETALGDNDFFVAIGKPQKRPWTKISRVELVAGDIFTFYEELSEIQCSINRVLTGFRRDGALVCVVFGYGIKLYTNNKHH